MIPVTFPPGLTFLASKNRKIANWRDAHLIRWENGVTMRPVKGWTKLNLGPFASPVRKMHRWTTNAGTTLTAYLCEQHCYIESGGVLTDITPAGGMAGAPSNNGGYGDDLYGKGRYGTPRPGPFRKDVAPPIYSLDNWGQEIRVMTSHDGRYLGWSPSSPAGTKLTAVTNAPVSNRFFVITHERHAMIFGISGLDRFGWSDQEDDTDWAFGSITSRARFYNIYPKSPSTTGLIFEGGIIFFTPAMSYLVEWSGLPYVYTYRPIGKVSLPISPASICETPMGVVWPAVDGWWIFDGTVPRNLPCDIWDFINENVVLDQARFSAAVVHVSYRGELWWFFPDKNAAPGANNRYALFDYRGGIWSKGDFGRNCGFVFANEDIPLLAEANVVWQHNIGFEYPGAAMPWIESQNLSPNGGENWLTINKILPDVEGDIDALRFRVAKSNTRAGYTPDSYSPQRRKNSSGFVDIRETARDMRLRIDMVKESDWGTVGPILFDSKVRGKK